MKTICIIPVRSGSKGLQHKNIRPFAHSSLLEIAIKQSLSCSLIDETVVSTDSEQYRELALKAGANAPFIRPTRISGDHATDLDVFKHALEYFMEQKKDFEIVVHLRATYPLRSSGEIEECIKKLISNPTIDSIRSVCPSASSPFKMYLKGPNNTISPACTLDTIPDAHNSPRQDLPTAYEHNGAIDVVRSKCILSGSMTGKHISPYIMSHNYDIDTLEEFNIAEKAYLNNFQS